MAEATTDLASLYEITWVDASGEETKSSFHASPTTSDADIATFIAALQAYSDLSAVSWTKTKGYTIIAPVLPSPLNASHPYADDKNYLKCKFSTSGTRKVRSTISIPGPTISVAAWGIVGFPYSNDLSMTPEALGGSQFLLVVADLQALGAGSRSGHPIQVPLGGFIQIQRGRRASA